MLTKLLIALTRYSDDFGHDLAIDADGRIVTAGFTQNGLATESALMRALP